jgi:uracil-DNA glycosylase family 4
MKQFWEAYKNERGKYLDREGTALSRKELLEAIASEIIVCHKCRLSKNRKNAVPGEGNPDSQIMFIGEGPGRSEDIEGRPFVGQAGKLLGALLSEAFLSRWDAFICNVVRCRPPRNREPLPDEVQTCTPYLDRQIGAIQPKVIVTLGNCSTSYIFSKAKLHFSGITQARGRFYEASVLGVRATIFPTFHPAAALYDARYKDHLLRDFQLLGSKLVERGIVSWPSS